MAAWLARKLKSLRRIKSGEWKKDRSFDVNDSMYQDPRGNRYNVNMTEDDYNQLVAEWTFVANVSYKIGLTNKYGRNVLFSNL